MRFLLRTLLIVMIYAALTFGNLALVFNSVKGVNFFQFVAAVATRLDIRLSSRDTARSVAFSLDGNRLANVCYAG